MTSRGWYLLVAVGLVPLTGCIGSGWDDSLGTAWQARWAGWEDPDAEGAAGSVATVRDPAKDATPVVDIVAASLVETPDSLIVSIDVAALPGDLGTLATAGWRDIAWELCWTSPANPGSRSTDQCTGVAVDLMGPRPDVKGHFGIYIQEGCNDWAWCDWQVSYDLSPGTPGTVSVVVPRALLAAGEQGSNLTTPFVWTHGTTSDGVTLDDSSPTMPNFTFRTAHRSSPARGSTLLVDDKAGDTAPADGNHSDLDVVTVRQSKSATAISWRIEFVHLPETASHQLYAAVGIGERVIEAWYTLEAGEVVRSGGGYCTKGCNDYVEFPVKVRLESGAPGTVVISLPTTRLPTGISGERVSLADFYVWEPRRDEESPGIHPPADASLFEGDWAWGAWTSRPR